MAGVSRHHGFAEQEETSSLDSIQWTDEKHSLYLKSMEASFVHQLYNSKDLFSSYSNGEHALDGRRCTQGEPPPGQSKAHQHGYWQQTFYRAAPQLEGAGRYGSFLANRHTQFTATGNDAFEQQRGQILSSCGPGNISRMLVDGEHHQVSLNFDEEVSDQNFFDEDCENRAASGQRAKRLRTLDASAPSSNDQVVPLGISSHLPVQHRD